MKQPFKSMFTKQLSSFCFIVSSIFCEANEHFNPLNSSDKRTLVIILSETRAWELTYPNIKKNLLDTLDADLAICIGVGENYDYDNPFYQNAKYRFLYEEPTDYATAFDYAYDVITKETPPDENHLHWRNFLQIKDQFLGGIKDPKDEHPGSAGILIFYRWFLLKNILENGLLYKYDYFVITRSDYIYTLPHPKMDILSTNFIYIPDAEHYGGVTDRHSVVPKQFVVPYLNILNNMVVKGRQYYDKMEHFSNWNLERLIKFHLQENEIFKYVKFFPYVMYTIRPIGGSSRWSEGVFSKQHNCFIKYSTEYEKSHFYKNLFEQEDENLDMFYKKHISQ